MNDFYPDEGFDIDLLLKESTGSYTPIPSSEGNPNEDTDGDSEKQSGKTVVKVFLDHSTREKLKLLAHVRGNSMSEIIRQVVEKHLDKYWDSFIHSEESQLFVHKFFNK